MAGYSGISMADEILNFFYRGQTISIGAFLYLRLLVAPASRSGGGTETSYGGYARLALSRGTTLFGASTNGQLTNSVVFTFPSATTTGNGDLLAFDIVDTPSGAFTKVYNGGPILPARAVEVGKPPKFRVGALVITF